MKQLPVDEFASLMQVEEAEDVQCIDVREEWEASIASIPGFQLFPLSRWAAPSLVMGEVGFFAHVQSNEKIISSQRATALVPLSVAQILTCVSPLKHQYELCQTLRTMHYTRMEEWETKLTTVLDPQKPTFCLCHHGIRSQRVRKGDTLTHL